MGRTVARAARASRNRDAGEKRASEMGAGFPSVAGDPQQTALEEAIIGSVQHIDIVRLFELKEEREAKQRALQT